jgi:hypothetical protein
MTAKEIAELAKKNSYSAPYDVGGRDGVYALAFAVYAVGLTAIQVGASLLQSWLEKQEESDDCNRLRFDT